MADLHVKRLGATGWGVFLAVSTAWAASASSTPAPPPAAEPGVLFRCTAPSGAVALQDAPCPKGHREERREIPVYAAAAADAVPTPAPTSPAADTAPGSADPPRIEAGVAPPARPLSMPPPLFRCTDLNGATRLVEQDDPQPRCVPLSVLGVDLSRAPPGAATLCRNVTDPCIELGGDAACAAWEERLAAAEAALRTAFSDTMAERRRERDRILAILENDCRP